MEGQGFQLTAQQMSFFRTFGYLSFPGLMTDRIEEILREFEAVWVAHGGGHNGKPHDGKARSCIVPFIDQSETLCSLLDDPRILGIASSILGGDFNYTGSDGNFYVGETRWHSDGARKPEDPIHIKIAFYLDPLTRDSGALRVIPGSHHFGDGYADSLSDQVRDSQELWGLQGRDIPAAVLETQPGDLVMFNHNTKHAAFGGGIRRRMFTINLSQRYPEDRLEDLHDHISTASRFWINRKYGEKMVRTAGPERMRHLEQNMANDGHLAELSRQARERMSEPSRG
ncbi:MAG: phytanoyl-CoA dioxygenase family protein [Candidatus Poribacteria bacterium]|nr:phytanoyl-CoA dioxygenase family protein [Candidatus Poribacteria bacterium]